MSDNLARWFMSYAYRLKAIEGPEDAHFGSCVSTGEHPLEKVARWNREYDYRTHVLLHYHRMTDGEPQGDFDHEF